MTLSDKIIVFLPDKAINPSNYPIISKEFQTRIMYNDYSDEKG